MGNNVIILGAGFSYDAGVPLMSGFVEAMWEMSVRKSYRGKALSEADTKIFDDAAKVRHELDGYHGRSNFDDRNIEDILSILSFNVLSGSKAAQEHLRAINRAIARLVELTSQVTHPGVPGDGDRWSIIEQGPAIYRTFWKELLKRKIAGDPLATIITFNYDLVLESSLLQLLIGTELEDAEQRPHHFRVNYHLENVPSEIWRFENCTYGQFHTERRSGHVVKRTGVDSATNTWEIDILKLHGSVNFPSTPLKKGDPYNIAAAIPDPNILPPIFNKLSSSTPNKMWKVALERLNQAQNVIIVGYSLPQTDIYMQYFLKAAVGPNLNLNKIIVFNPTLFRNDKEADAMRARYEGCFSEQLRRRIEFNPQYLHLSSNIYQNHGGSTEHFVAALAETDKSVLF